MKNRAFTPIELLIVVAIIGILAAIAVPNFTNALIRAKIGRVYGDMSAISRAKLKRERLVRKLLLTLQSMIKDKKM